MRQDVVIAIPAYDRRLSVDIASLLWRAQGMNADDSFPYRFHLVVEAGKSPVDYARNCIVRRIRERYADSAYTLWIDNDTMVDPNVANILVAAEQFKLDIVSALVPVVGRRADGSPYPAVACYKTYDPEAERLVPIRADEYGEANVIGGLLAVGFGCVLVRTAVLTDPRMEFAPPSRDGTPSLFRFQREPNGYFKIGEDIDFCQRARSLGYSIAAYTDSVSGHLKTCDLLDVFRAA